MANSETLGDRMTCLVAEYHRLSEDWRLHASDIRWYVGMAFLVHGFALPLVAQMHSKVAAWIYLPVFVFLWFVIVASWLAAKKSRKYADECAKRRTKKGDELNELDDLFKADKPCCKEVKVECCKEGTTFTFLIWILIFLLGVDISLFVLLFVHALN